MNTLLVQLLSIIGILNAFISGFFYWKIRRFEKSLDNINLQIVRSVLEDNPDLSEKVLSLAKKLNNELFYAGANSGLLSYKEARRLLGLDP